MSDKLLQTDGEVEPWELTLGRDVIRVLDKHFPGWMWSVEFPSTFANKPGMVVIRNTDCDPRGKMGFALPLTDLASDPDMHCVMLAGGEFLERYRMRTRGYRPGDLDGRTMVLERPQS